MKLTYWYSRCLGDTNQFSLRAKTRREVKAMLSANDASVYSKIVKVEIEYADGFDLMQMYASAEYDPEPHPS